MIDFDPALIRRYDQSGPRYTSYPSADRFQAGFPAQAVDAALAARNAAGDLSLYFHIPFCKTLCFYCGCHRIPTRRAERGTRYVDFLIEEMHLVASRLCGPKRVRQIHLGGGTPTFLSTHDLARLMTEMRRLFEFVDDVECGIEVDPRSVDATRIEELAAMGFNRLSLGVQDFDPEVQKAINRIQSEEETLGVLEAARSAGFASISVDLIYGLPHQTTERFARTLERVIAFRPDRIAVYNYAHMPERFPAQSAMPREALPGPDAKLALLGLTIATLEAAGYEYIGMDHFALATDELAIAQREGSLQRNFQGYSTHANCEMLGFGVSAIGCVGGTYLQNSKDIESWEAAIVDGRLPVVRGYTLNDDDRLRSKVIQLLMCRLEIDTRTVTNRLGRPFWECFGDVREALLGFARDGLLALGPHSIRILPRGRLLVRHIAMAFDAHLTQPGAARYSRVI